MAYSIKLEVYSLHLNKYRSSKKIPIGDFSKSLTFSDFVSSYIESYAKKLEVDEDSQKAMIIDTEYLSIQGDQKMISCIVKCGDYGVEVDEYDINSRQHVGTIPTDHARVMPFYFLLYLPDHLPFGIMILQRIGIFGINTLFTDHLCKFFAKEYPEFRLKTKPMVTKDLAKKFIDSGSLKALTLTSWSLSPDLANNLGILNFKNKELKVKVSIEALEGGSLGLNFKDKVKSFVGERNVRAFTVDGLAPLGMDGTHDTKVVVEVGKNKRTMDLNDLTKMRPYYNVSDRVDKDSSGHPVFNSIDKEAKSLIIDLVTDLT